jgi:hypothetical protein
MAEITDAMIEAALDAWYEDEEWREPTASCSGADNERFIEIARRDMRKALEAALAVRVRA